MQEAIDLFPKWARLADHIRGQIRSGELAQGAELPSTAQLRDEHNVSDSVVRYALHALYTEGLVEGAPGAGIFVVERR